MNGHSIILWRFYQVARPANVMKRNVGEIRNRYPKYAKNDSENPRETSEMPDFSRCSNRTPTELQWHAANLYQLVR